MLVRTVRTDDRHVRDGSVIARMTFLSILIKRRNFFISIASSAARDRPRAAAGRRTANRPLVEISPVMSRFNVVIPRLRRVIICQACHIYVVACLI